MPVPLIRLMSTLCSRAIFRTSGEDFWRRRSSIESGARRSGVRPAPAPVAGPSEAAATAAWPGLRLTGRSLGHFRSARRRRSRSRSRRSRVSGGGGGVDPPMTATTEFTGTVSPSFTLISVRTPAPGDGISASTLSVEISNSGSSRSTLSPIFLIQRTMVPSAMDSPIWGMTTFVAIVNTLPVSWPRRPPSRRWGGTPLRGAGRKEPGRPPRQSA